jgi:TPR repeat protein
MNQSKYLFKLSFCFLFLFASYTIVAQETKQKINWVAVEKEAQNGDMDAQYFLGLAYDVGQDLPRDYSKSAFWYKKSAEQGNIEAQYFLGDAFLKGQGVTKSDAEAAKWFQKAAIQGYVHAQAMMGALYSLGQGVPKNFVLSYTWYNLAAANGSEDAAKGRDLAEKVMTPEQIAEAQALSAKWKVGQPMQ